MSFQVFGFFQGCFLGFCEFFFGKIYRYSVFSHSYDNLILNIGPDMMLSTCE